MKVLQKHRFIKRIISLGMFPSGGDKIHVAVGIDRNYARPMGVLFTSILLHNKDVAFHIFSDDLLDDDIKRLRTTAEQYRAFCAWYVVDPSPVSSLPTLRLTTAAYFRLIAGEYFSEVAIPRFLYLDSDMLCLGDIRPLFSVNLQGKSVAAVRDSGLPPERLQKIGHTGDGYFNSGMLLVDTSRWKKDRIFEEVIRLRSDRPERFQTVDQDVLNLVYSDKVLWVDKKYNQENNVADMYPLGTVILHYTSTPKPWLAWYFCSGKNYWAEVSSVSEWWDVPVISEPRSTRECRLLSRALFHRGEIIQGIVWYVKYLKNKMALLPK